jgi:DNA-binding MarR family transcriptional regulator
MDEIDIRGFRKDLRIFERQVELSLQAQTECCGVTTAQCHLLLEAEERGESSVGELAAALELDASTLSRTVDGLVRKGFLSRREDPDNRRRQLVRLGAQGKKKAEEINALCDEFYRSLLRTLSSKDSAAVLKALPLFSAAIRSWRTGATALPPCSDKKEGTE